MKNGKIMVAMQKEAAAWTASGRHDRSGFLKYLSSKGYTQSDLDMVVEIMSDPDPSTGSDRIGEWQVEEGGPFLGYFRATTPESRQALQKLAQDVPLENVHEGYSKNQEAFEAIRDVFPITSSRGDIPPLRVMILFQWMIAHAHWQAKGRRIIEITPEAVMSIRQLPAAFPSVLPETDCVSMTAGTMHYSLGNLSVHFQNAPENSDHDGIDHECSVPTDGCILVFHHENGLPTIDIFPKVSHKTPGLHYTAPPFSMVIVNGHFANITGTDPLMTRDVQDSDTLMLLAKAYLASLCPDIALLMPQARSSTKTQRRQLRRAGDSAQFQRLYLKPGALETWKRRYIPQPAPLNPPTGIQEPSPQPEDRLTAHGLVAEHIRREHMAIYWVLEPEPGEEVLGFGVSPALNPLFAVYRPVREYTCGQGPRKAQITRIMGVKPLPDLSSTTDQDKEA